MEFRTVQARVVAKPRPTYYYVEVEGQNYLVHVRRTMGPRPVTISVGDVVMVFMFEHEGQLRVACAVRMLEVEAHAQEEIAFTQERDSARAGSGGA